jgi:predicted DNA-binding transcriptional regulator AlpA
VSDVLYIPDMARKLGRTEAAIRAAVQRDQLRGSRKKALPPSFKLGSRHAWRRVDVEEWLARKASGG